ncbi:hypothetical protein [Tardiphaga sp.]|jgi:hypothetical protein|uniref:hypothetical protein n=1 Tax=Tardiphaga sp. TaxID=1926292 RepID=UPI0037D9B387
MKKIAITAAVVSFMSTAAFAQTTGENMRQPNAPAGATNHPMQDPNRTAIENGKTSGSNMRSPDNSTNVNRGAATKDGDGQTKGGMKTH